LLCFPLQHHGRFTGSKRGTALNDVGLSPKRHALAGAESVQFFVVSLRIDSLHGLVSYHIGAQSLNRRWFTRVGKIDFTDTRE
jgi:hypothetical protein